MRNKLVLLTGWLVLLVGMSFVANRKEAEEALPVYVKAEVVLHTSKGVSYVNEKPFTGKLVELTAGGDTLSVTGYENGREHGHWKSFYENGALQYIRYYERGKKKGDLTMWYDNGQVQLKAHFENDEYEGRLQEWAPSGQLLKSMQYSKGHEAGAQRAWYPSGKVRSNYTVIDGRRYGLLGTKHCINVTDSITAL